MGVKRYACRMQTVSEIAAQRLKILTFWGKHGLSATLDAFEVSRRTLDLCKAAYRQGRYAPDYRPQKTPCTHAPTPPRRAPPQGLHTQGTR